MFQFVRTYPGQSAIVLLALILAGMVEGFSMTALLPVLTAAMAPRQDGGEVALGDTVSPYLLSAFNLVGLTPTLGVLIAILVAGTLLRSGFVLLANRYVGFTIAKVATDLRLGLLKALLAARWAFYLRQPVGVLANAMSSEPDRASKAYFFGTSMLAAVIQMLAYLGVAASISWQATLAYLVGAAVVVYGLHFFVRMARRSGKRQTRGLKALVHQLTDCLQSVKPLKAMGREDLADRVIAAESLRLNKALEREVLSKEALKAVQAPAFVVLVAAGFYLGVVYWRMEAAEVVVLLLLLSRVMNGMGKVQQMLQNMAVCESAYWSLCQTINEARQQVEPVGGERTATLERAIEFEHVEFAYDDQPVLKDFSLTIPARKLTALIGFSGAGKTTVVDLIIGLLSPRLGRILIDGVDLRDLNLRAWRRMIGYVPQENLLLHDSIFANVTFGDPDLTEQDAKWALQAAGCWEFVAALPEGIHTLVGERGARLSGGQRQRIMIARALVHKPTLLILDEATSALDPESQRAICRTLVELKAQITILAISHQPILVEIADEIYQLGHGTAWRVTEPRTAVAALS
ncbi:MAG: ABC transporter ATP-binding protein/permease [Methylohalobius sp.]|nr:ABC transporter ATP-binding protein/permease [Methylohalobius sp.]